MWFEQTSFIVGRRVKPEFDCFSMLEGSVEGIAEVHEECIAVPPEMVLNIKLESHVQWRRFVTTT